MHQHHLRCGPAILAQRLGGGARYTIQHHATVQEVQLVLATLVQRVTVELVPGQPIAPEPLITLRRLKELEDMLS